VFQLDEPGTAYLLSLGHHPQVGELTLNREKLAIIGSSVRG